MESVFNDHVFPKYMSQQVMKPQIMVVLAR